MWYKLAEIVFGLLLVGWLYGLTIRQQHIADRADAVLGALERILERTPSKGAPRTSGATAVPKEQYTKLRDGAMPPVPTPTTPELEAYLLDGASTEVMRVVGRHRSE